MKHRLNRTAAAVALALTAFAPGAMAAGSVAESDEPIKLAMLEWTGLQAVTKVAANVLECMGYNVEFVTSGTYTQFFAIPDGTITASLEIWSSNTGEHYPKAMASGNVEVLGDLDLEPVET